MATTETPIMTTVAPQPKFDVNTARLANLAKAREIKKLKSLAAKSQVNNSVQPTSVSQIPIQTPRVPTFSVTPLTRQSNYPNSSQNISQNIIPTTSTRKRKSEDTKSQFVHMSRDYESEDSEEDSGYEYEYRRKKAKSKGEDSGGYSIWGTIYSVGGLMFAAALFEFFKIFAGNAPVNPSVGNNQLPGTIKSPNRNNIISNQSIFR
jgi:hypothetical protein